MRELLPDPIEDPDIHAVYARDWIGTGGVRVNFVSSVDGAMEVDGRSRGLQTPGDNRVFAALRDLADVVLVGAGTARAEKYGPVVPDTGRRATRARFGMPARLPIAVLSGRLDLNLDSALFQPPEGGPRPIVITRGDAPGPRRTAVAERADLIVAGEGAVDLAAARTALEARGLYRILCEGGPSLFGSLLTARVADELCLTLSPMLTGGETARITGVRELPPDVVSRLSLAGLLEEDGALFARYRIS